jgi:hypothetical protein
MMFIAAGLLLVSSAPAAVPSKPHLHYEIIVSDSGRTDETPEGRLHRACELTGAVAERTKNNHDPILALDLAMLRHVACDKPKSN